MSTPEKIGRYEILRELGRGGMATVYLAHDPVIGREVAVKVLPREFLHDPNFRARFEREVKTIAALDHPHIVPVYDSGEVDGQPFLVMRYMAGGSLKELLATGPLPYDRAESVLKRIAAALDEAHTQGVVHRDLKPANILFDHRGDAYLSDFGIVKLAQATANYTGSAVIGTPAYMSPEQVTGEQAVDGRSDIYSLGILLFQMLTGRMPYDAETPAQQMMAHVLKPIPSLLSERPDLPLSYQTALERALAKAPGDRFETATGLVTALSQPILPPLPHDADDAAPEPVRARVPLWGWGAGGVMLLIILGLLFFRPGGAVSPTPTPNATTTAIAAALQIPPTVTVTPSVTPPTPTRTPTPSVTPTPWEPTDTPTPTPFFSPTPTPTVTSTPGPGPEVIVLGQSAGGSNLFLTRIGNGPSVVLFVGGISAGFAPSSVEVMEEAITYFEENPEDVPTAVTLYILPRLNPDSEPAPGELAGRLNGNGVDLNRNWDCRWRADTAWRSETLVGGGGTAPFSEPETAALSNFILEKQPVAVVFWQARINNGLVSPGACGIRPIASEPLARTFSLAADYEVADYEDLVSQEVNGDSVNWIDWQGIPAITILLPDYDEIDWENNLAGMLAVLQTSTQ